MGSVDKILRFYRDCYAYDYRALNVKNFFGKSTQNAYVLEDAYPLIKGEYDRLVERKWGETVAKKLELYSKEKSLYAGSLFLFGSSKELNKKIRVACPLFLHEVKLTNNFGNFRILLDLENPVINPYFLEFISKTHGKSKISYEEFTGMLPKGPLSPAEVIKLESLFEEHFPQIDISGLSKWLIPHAKSQNPRFIYKQNSTSNENKLVAGICIGLINKQEGSRGVINELNELAGRSISNTGLNEIFNQDNFKKTIVPAYEIDIPIPLSHRQKEVFYNARHHNFSLVIGPPGSGKSYTIAALASQYISEGRSVLIASKNSQAGSVVADKIENEIGLKGIVIKASRRSYKRHLSNKINNILSGFSTANPPSRNDISIIKGKIRDINLELDRELKTLRLREIEERDWASFFQKNKQGFFAKYKERWIEYKHRKARKIWQIKDKVDLLQKRKLRLQKKFFKLRYEYNLHENLRLHRRDIRTFAKTLEAETGSALRQHFNEMDFKNVLKSIPGWIINTADASEILPLDARIFDLLIIDEASQCDVSSCLPLIYRSRKTVIIGDPKQLRHLSFLSKKREALLNQRHGINGHRYRDYSILDLLSDRLTSQAQITFLNEHFRSAPDIIEFSNTEFYERKLLVMTANPISNIQKHLYLKKLDGYRNPKGQNEVEVEEIISKILDIISNERALAPSMSSSIGIISPFRAQVNLIKEQIRKQFQLNEIRKHDILVGTPFHFQGEERDVVLLSFTLDAKTHPSTFIYLNREDVFNVTVTRARSLQIVYTSLESKDIDANTILSGYLRHVESPRLPKKSESKELSLYDDFLREVKQSVLNWKVDRVLSSYPISGVMIDLVIVNNHKTFCIDLIGYSEDFENMFTSYQLDMLERMGHKVFFLPYSEWHLNRNESIESLHKFIHSKKQV